jgi:hypothetical protein
VVRGGQPSFSGGGSTLPALLKRIAGAEHANDLVAQLSVGGGGATKKTIIGTRVVRGHRFFRVAIVGTGGSATATS